MTHLDLFCVEGLLESGVVDFVWGMGFRLPTVAAIRAAQHGIDRSPGEALPGRAVIFCFNTHLPTLLEELNSHAGGRYIIVSRDCDPGLSQSNWGPHIHHIFAGNVGVAGDRLTPMPGAFGPWWSNADGLTPALHVPRKHTNKVLVSYSLDTPGSVYHAGHERVTAIEYFRHQPWATVNENLLGWATRTGPVWPSWSWPDYLALLREYDYCVVPCGYGVDRYAQWEAMTLGAIPICLKHQALLHFADMPIAFVNNWSDVTPEWCDANLGIINRSTEKLRLSYWVERIREKRKEIDLS